MTLGLNTLLSPRLRPFGLSSDTLLERDAPSGLDVPGVVSANGHCRLLPCRDAWIALNLARPGDVDLVPALTGRQGAPWQAVLAAAAASDAAAFRDLAVELQLPVAVLGEAAPIRQAEVRERSLAGLRVVDMSALWAGPLCAGLLARCGASVLRIESVGRPDPTPALSPVLSARINGGKRGLSLDLRKPEHVAQLHAEVRCADVFVTSARRAALARLGFEPEGLLRERPDLTWVAITAHGFTGAGADRVGFGDDCAVAGGLVDRRADGNPLFLGDALADPLTGLEGALTVLEGSHRGLVDLAMAGVAAAYSRAMRAWP